jgi:hypothetical protein
MQTAGSQNSQKPHLFLDFRLHHKTIMTRRQYTDKAIFFKFGREGATNSKPQITFSLFTLNVHFKPLIVLFSFI